MFMPRKSKELEKAVFVMIYGKDGEDCTCKAEDVAKELKCEIVSGMTLGDT